MPIVADAGVAIRGDLSKFSGDLKKTEGQVQTLGGKLSAALSPKALIGGLAGAFAASQVFSFFGDAISAASDLNETISKTGEVLGKEALPGLQKWAKGAADTFGQSEQQALDAASSFAIFGKSAGLAGNDLVGFSTELTQLSADFASFFNTSPEDAITAISAALRGESEPIRRYGILLDEATLRQRAMKLGIIETTTQALTPQQRVLAAQAEILAQSSDAQGDFARTGDGLANSQRKLRAELSNLMVDIGNELLPLFLEVVKVVSKGVIPAIKTAIPVVKELVPVIAVGLGVVAVNALRGLATQAMLTSLALKTLLPLAIAAAALEMKSSIDDSTRSMALAEAQSRLSAGAYKALLAELERSGDWGKAAAAAEQWSGDVQWAADDAMNGVTNILRDGKGKIVGSAQIAFGPITAEMRAAKEAAIAAARALPGDLAQALISGQADVESGMTALTDLMKNSLSDAAKIAYYKGVLGSKELARGLTDERADVRASAQAIKDEATYQLSLLTSGAADAAVNAGTTFAEQLRLQSVAAGTAAAALRLRAAKELQFDAGPIGARVGTSYMTGVISGVNAYLHQLLLTSGKVQGILALAGSPWYTHSRLIGHEVGRTWGEALNQSLAKVRLNLPDLSVASGDMALMALPSSAGRAALGASSGTALASGNTTSVTIYNPEPRAADADMGRMLRRLGAMGITS